MIRADEPGAPGHLLHMHAEVIEQADEEAFEIPVGVNLTNTVDEARGETWLA